MANVVVQQLRTYLRIQTLNISLTNAIYFIVSHALKSYHALLYIFLYFSWERASILIKETIIYSKMRSASYFDMYERTILIRYGRCQLQNNRVATRRYVVLSKIITSASSTWHGIRQRYVDQNWLDHIAWQRRPAADRIYREILRVVKRFWTRHGKVGAPRHFCGPLLIFLLRKSNRPSLADAVRRHRPSRFN